MFGVQKQLDERFEGMSLIEKRQGREKRGEVRVCRDESRVRPPFKRERDKSRNRNEQEEFEG
jgi:hypothetical protein